MENKNTHFFLRSTSGKVAEVPEQFKFLEIRSYDGLVSHVFSVEDNQIIMFTKDDKEAIKYKARYPEVEFCPVLDVDAMFPSQ
jgi:hypothetical protein